MKELRAIRQAIFSALENNIDGVTYYHNGRPIFLDVENEMPAISVFIEDTHSDGGDLCGSYWSGSLNVVVYHKSAMPEDKLDELMEKVVVFLNTQTFAELDNFSLESVTYSYDEQQTQWIAGTLQYNISFYRGDNE